MPRVSNRDGAFQVSVEVIDPTTRSTLWVATEDAHQSQDLLSAMDTLIDGIA
ncbi:MAG: hypothetical protein IPO66_00165 [Rhodanobacteraceae bacterium]|nr:hypothetical protein [Rhodanobacteraceae bacterium]